MFLKHTLCGRKVSIAVLNDDVALYVYTDAAGAYRFPAVPYGETSLEIDSEGEADGFEVEPENRENPLVRDFKVTIDEE